MVREENTLIVASNVSQAQSCYVLLLTEADWCNLCLTAEQYLQLLQNVLTTEELSDKTQSEKIR